MFIGERKAREMKECDEVPETMNERNNNADQKKRDGIFQCGKILNVFLT